MSGDRQGTRDPRPGALRELARLRAWLAVRLGGAEDADFELVVGRPAG